MTRKNQCQAVHDLEDCLEDHLQEAGIEGLRFYYLRHTFASRLLQRGANLKTVQELLGHKAITTTMRYAHLAKGDCRRAVDLLAKSPVPQRKSRKKDRNRKRV